MTVKELIEKLEQIEDKDKIVKFRADTDYDTYSTVDERDTAILDFEQHITIETVYR